MLTLVSVLLFIWGYVVKSRVTSLDRVSIHNHLLVCTEIFFSNTAMS